MEFFSQNNGDRRKGLVATILIHGLLLLLFIILGLTAPYPPPPEEGVMISFGNSEVGSGEEQPEQIEEITSESQEQPTEETIENTEPVVEEEIVEQELEDAPSLEQQENPTEEIVEEIKEEVKETPVEEVKEQPEEKKPTVDESLLFNKDKLNNSTSEGKDEAKGDKGKLDGDLSKDGLVGLGNEGIGFDLSGRSMILKPPIEDNSQATGKVVVRIKVDRYGKVLFAKYQLKGSTTNDPHLVKIAEEAAGKAKFNHSQYAKEEQYGTITFTFKVK